MSVREQLRRYGDGLISRGSGPVFVYLGFNRLTLRITNGHINHITWSTLGTALLTLDDFMRQRSYGKVTFSIRDETGEVGLGTVV